MPLSNSHCYSMAYGLAKIIKKKELHHDGMLVSAAQKWCTVLVRDRNFAIDWVILMKK